MNLEFGPKWLHNIATVNGPTTIDSLCPYQDSGQAISDGMCFFGARNPSRFPVIRTVEAHVLRRRRRRERMARETILYISDQTTCSDSVSVALKTAGYEVVSTKSTMQAIALLFILHPVAAAVLHSQEGEQTSLDVARNLRAVRPDVPIVVLCRDPIDRLPASVDAFVSQPLAGLISEVQRLLTSKRTAHDPDSDASDCLREPRGAASTKPVSRDPEPLQFQLSQGRVNSCKSTS